MLFNFKSHIKIYFQEEDAEAEMYWLQFSDFYDWPHIQLYDDYDDLKKKLLKADFQSIHKRMNEEIAIRGLQLNRRWCETIEKIRRSKLHHE